MGASGATSMSRTIPRMSAGPVPGAQPLRVLLHDFDDTECATTVRVVLPKAAGPVRVGGIVRDMDVAPEAYMDVLAAFPPTRTGPAAPSW